MLLRHLRKAHTLSFRTGKLLILVSMLVLIEGVLWYLLPSQFENSFGIELAGVAVAAYGLASVLTNIPMADISDRVSRSFTVSMGILLMVLSLLLLHVISFPIACAIMFFLGMGSTCINAGALQTVLDQTHKGKSGRIAGIYYAFRSIGWSFGSVIGSVLMFSLSFSNIALVLFVLAVAFYCKFVQLLPQKNPVKKVKMSLKLLFKDSLYRGEITRLRQYGLLLCVYMFYCLSFGIYEYAIWTAEPIYMANMGTHIILGALILCFLELPRLLFSTSIGSLVDKVGGRTVVKLAVLFTLLSHVYFIWFSNQDVVSLVIMFVIMAITDIGIMLAFNAQLNSVVARDMRAQVFGSGEMMYDVGGVVAPLIVGLVLRQNMNFGALFSVTFILYVFVAVAMIVLYRKDRRLFQLAATKDTVHLK